MFIHKALYRLTPARTMNPSKLVQFSVGLESASYSRRSSRLEYALLIETVLNIAAFLIAFEYAFHVPLDLNHAMNEIEGYKVLTGEKINSSDGGSVGGGGQGSGGDGKKSEFEQNASC